LLDAFRRQHLFGYRDWRGKIHETLDLVVKRWVDQIARNVEWLGMGFTDDVRRYDCCPDEWLERMKLPRDSRVGGLMLSVDSGVSIVAGPRLLEMETALTGLGSTILDLLDQAAWRCAGGFTPARAIAEASSLYWQGEDNEALAIEELKRAGENPDVSELVRRADIEAQLPKWAIQPETHFSSDELMGLARRRKLRDFRDALDAAACLSALLPRVKESNALGLFGLEWPPGDSFLLCWTKDSSDWVNRIYDDYIHSHEWITEMTALVPFVVTVPGSVNRSVVQMGRLLEVASATVSVLKGINSEDC
jgi:PRTRC genetic system protein F